MYRYRAIAVILFFSSFVYGQRFSITLQLDKSPSPTMIPVTGSDNQQYYISTDSLMTLLGLTESSAYNIYTQSDTLTGNRYLDVNTYYFVVSNSSDTLFSINPSGKISFPNYVGSFREQPSFTLGINNAGDIIRYKDNDTLKTNELISSFVLQGDTLKISDAGGTRTVNLGPLLGGTDDQIITTFSIAADSLEVAIENGNSLKVDLLPYMDNTDDQALGALSISNDTLYISIEDGGTQGISLETYKQTISKPHEDSLAISDGNTILIAKHFGVTAVDTGEYTMEYGKKDTTWTIKLETFGPNMSPFGGGSDDQILSTNGDTLFIENGNYVILSGISTIPEEECQTINSSGMTLISGLTIPTDKALYRVYVDGLCCMPQVSTLSHPLQHKRISTTEINFYETKSNEEICIRVID